MTDQSRRSRGRFVQELDQGTGHTATPSEPAHERSVQEHEQAHGYPDKTVETGRRRTHAHVSAEARKDAAHHEEATRAEASRDPTSDDD